MSHFSQARRRAWIGLLSRAKASDIRALFQSLGSIPPYTEIHAPEAGMIMVRGRIGGSGAPFNLGEMTVTRCSVAVAGKTGHALVHGRRPEEARLAAVADALLQDEGWFEILHKGLIEPLESAERERAARRAQEAMATKVDFFTMVRGEDDK